MRVLAKISPELSSKIEDIFETKWALENLCLTLSNRNDLFKEKDSNFYTQIKDDIKSNNKELNSIIQYCIEKFNINPNTVWKVDFDNNQIFTEDEV